MMGEYSILKSQFYNSRITPEDLIALIKRQDVTVNKYLIGSNMYGEFLFVYATWTPDYSDPKTKVTILGKPRTDESFGFMFHGLGYHEYSGKVIRDFESNEDGNGFYRNIALNNKNEVINRIEERQEYILGKYPSNPERDQQQRMFGFISELTDDDAAYVMAEDYEDLCDELGFVED